MNNEKFARENKRIIEGMGIGAFVGPILALVMMYVKTAGSPQPFQIIMSMGAGLAFGLMFGGIMSASLVLNKTVASKIPWQKKVLKLALKLLVQE